MQTGLPQMERIPSALDGYILDLSQQLDRLAKNNSRLKSLNDKIVFEGDAPCREGDNQKSQDGIIPKLQSYSAMLASLINEQENQIERIERFI